MRFGILGPLRVIGDGEREIAITAGRDRTVLAMLLLHAGTIVGVEELIDAVWDERPPATARGQLQTCVSRLRRLMPPGMILTDPAGYGIAVAPNQLDAAEFVHRVARARAAAEVPGEASKLYREALTVWRGPALVGVDARAVRAGAAALDEQRLAVTEDWVDAELANGRAHTLVAELTGLVERYPLRERLRAQLMLALHRLGRQSDALAEYRRARDLLRDELGLEPGTVLQELHRRILRGDVEPDAGARAAPRPVRSLPRTVSDFTGRDEAIERLLKAAPHTGVLTVDGMAGGGKTTLALQVAALLADAYPDAQLFLDLQGHSESEPLTPGVALLALLRQLGVEPGRIPSDVDGRRGLWRTEIAGRRALVILDNAGSSAQVASLLPASPTSLCLVTSRRRLVGLDGGHPESLPVLDEPEGVTLLTKIAGPRVAAEPEAALAVVRRCGGLPLAIRLAGSRLAHRPRWRVSDLLRRLGESALPELAAEDRTVSSAFAVSYDQLGQPAQRVFRLLGLHPAERFRGAEVAALADLPLHDAQDALDELVDVHLVEEPEPERYRLHDLVRQYAASLADTLPPDERVVALGGLIDFHLYVGTRLALERESDYGHQDFPSGPPVRPELVALAAADPDWLEEHRTSVLPLIRAAGAIGQPRAAWGLARVNWRFLLQHGYYADVISTCEAGLAVAQRAGDEQGVALMNNYLASGYSRTGRMDEALTRVRVMLDYQIRSGDRSGEGRARANLSSVLLHLGRMTEALDEAQRAYSLLAETRHETALVVLRTDMTETFRVLGHHAEALRHGRIALQRMKETNADYFRSRALVVVGRARFYLGDLGPAERLAEAALRAALRHRTRTDESEALNLLGGIAHAQGRFALAIQRHLVALDIGRGHGRLARVARYSNDLAKALWAADDLSGAVQLHREALSAARRSAYRIEQARALHGLAGCLADGDAAVARR